MNHRRNNAVYAVAVISLMLALMLVFGYTPLATISFAGFSITLMGIPMAVISCLFGPWMGLFAGAVWGTIAFTNAWFGMDALGYALLNEPSIPLGLRIGGILTCCYVARMLVGFLSGLFFDLMHTVDHKGYWSSLVGSATVPLLNTTFFMTFFCLFFYSTDFLQQNYVLKLGAANPFLFVVLLVGWNFLIEFLVNTILGSTVTYGIYAGSRKLNVVSPFPHFFQKKQKKAAGTALK